VRSISQSWKWPASSSFYSDDAARSINLSWKALAPETGKKLSPDPYHQCQGCNLSPHSRVGHNKFQFCLGERRYKRESKVRYSRLYTSCHLLVVHHLYISSAMRSFLLASLASLAVDHVQAHPSAFPHGTRSLNRRVVDLSGFRGVVDTGENFKCNTPFVSGWLMF
jgi:hypothetical protein